MEEKQKEIEEKDRVIRELSERLNQPKSRSISPYPDRNEVQAGSQIGKTQKLARIYARKQARDHQEKQKKME